MHVGLPAYSACLLNLEFRQTQMILRKRSALLRGCYMGSGILSCDGTLTPKPALTLSGNGIIDNNMSVNARIRQMEALVLMLGVN